MERASPFRHATLFYLRAIVDRGIQPAACSAELERTSADIELRASERFSDAARLP
jgi:hypothetical protein